MQSKNYIFIASSIDGYIADKNGGIDWLHTTVANPEEDDMGYINFMEKIDAIVMGRNTFEIVQSFDMEWPYFVPVFVASNTLSKVPKGLEGKVELVKGSPQEIQDIVHYKGYKHIYVDGGSTAQGFLQAGLINEITITTLPILLGDGIPLFGKAEEAIILNLVSTKTYVNAVTQNTYSIKQSV